MYFRCWAEMCRFLFIHSLIHSFISCRVSVSTCQGPDIALAAGFTIVDKSGLVTALKGARLEGRELGRKHGGDGGGGFLDYFLSPRV